MKVGENPSSFLKIFIVNFIFILKYCIRCCLLRFQNSPQTHMWEGFLLCETSPPSQFPPRDRSPSQTLLSLCLSFIFFLTSFQKEWAALWVPSVLWQCSEVVLWKLLNIQMIFWWICGEESVSQYYFSAS